VTFSLDVLSALAGIIGVVIAIAAQLIILTRRNRLRGRLKSAVELKKLVAEETGDAPKALAATLDDVIAYSARELTAIEAAWVRRTASSPLARLELLVLMGGVLLAAGVLSGLGLVAFGTSNAYAVVVSLAFVVVTLLAVIRYERGLKRAVAEAIRSGVGPARYPGRWTRYAIGVDEKVLTAYPDHVLRLTRLGFMTLVSALLPALALWATLGASWNDSLGPWFAVLGIVYAGYHLAVDRWIMSTPPPRSGWRRLRFVPAVVVSILFTLVFAEPLLLDVLSHQVAPHLPTAPSLLDRVHALSAAETSVSVAAIAWGVRLAILVVSILPIAVRLLSRTTAYDEAIRAGASDVEIAKPEPVAA
jgi:hypothetical protein